MECVLSANEFRIKHDDGRITTGFASHIGYENWWDRPVSIILGNPYDVVVTEPKEEKVTEQKTKKVSAADIKEGQNVSLLGGEYELDCKKPCGMGGTDYNLAFTLYDYPGDDIPGDLKLEHVDPGFEFDVIIDAEDTIVRSVIDPDFYYEFRTGDYAAKNTVHLILTYPDGGNESIYVDKDRLKAVVAAL